MLLSLGVSAVLVVTPRCVGSLDPLALPELLLRPEELGLVLNSKMRIMAMSCILMPTNARKNTTLNAIGSRTIPVPAAIAINMQDPMPIIVKHVII